MSPFGDITAFFFSTFTTQVLAADTAHKVNVSASVHLWRELCFHKIPQACQGKEPPYREGHVSSCLCVPLAELQSLNHRGAWNPVTAPQIRAFPSFPPVYSLLPSLSRCTWARWDLKATKKPIRILKPWNFFLSKKNPSWKFSSPLNKSFPPKWFCLATSKMLGKKT